MAKIPMQQQTEEREQPTRQTNNSRREWKFIPAETVLSAQIEKAEIGDHPFFKDDSGSPERALLMEFSVVEGEFAGRTIRGNVPVKKQRALNAWIEAVLGFVPNQPDTDDLLGRFCRVRVGHKEKPRRDGREGMWHSNWVEDVLPMKGDPMAVEDF